MIDRSETSRDLAVESAISLVSEGNNSTQVENKGKSFQFSTNCTIETTSSQTKLKHATSILLHAKTNENFTKCYMKT